VVFFPQIRFCHGNRHFELDEVATSPCRNL
jgi:hypothetical protein